MSSQRVYPYWAKFGAFVVSAFASACAGGDASDAADDEALAASELALSDDASGDEAELTVAETDRELAEHCSEHRTVGRHPLPPRYRRNVILIIGDGMQLEDEIAISRYLHGRDFAATWDRFPYHGFVATWDVTTYDKYAAAAGAATFDAASYDPRVGYDPARAGAKPYPLENPPGLSDYLQIGAGFWWAATDSASAATAMSTGIKTDDGNIAWMPGDPADGARPTVGEVLRAERGMSFGIVSTQPISHATPAAFASHNVYRNNYAAIAEEIVSVTKPEVVIGGGYPKLTDPPKYTYISDTTYAKLSSSTEYVLVERNAGTDGGAALLTAADQAVAEGKKLFGLFGGKSGTFETRVPADDPGHPSVGPGSTENPTLAEAAEAALRVLSQDRQGFFLMVEQGDLDTANHGNNFTNMIACAADLDETVARVVRFVNQPRDGIDWSNTVVLVVADHATGYPRLNPERVLGKGDLPTRDCTVSPPSCYPDGEVSYGTTGHSNELVHVSARGRMARMLRQCEGREYPGTRIIDNTALYWFMLRAGGL